MRQVLASCGPAEKSSSQAAADLRRLAGETQSGDELARYTLELARRLHEPAELEPGQARPELDQAAAEAELALAATAAAEAEARAYPVPPPAAAELEALCPGRAKTRKKKSNGVARALAALRRVHLAEHELEKSSACPDCRAEHELAHGPDCRACFEALAAPQVSETDPDAPAADRPSRRAEAELARLARDMDYSGSADYQRDMEG